MTEVQVQSLSSNSSSESSPAKKTIRIGDETYVIDVTRIPYFMSLVHFQTHAQSESSELVHGSIPYFSVALKGLEEGFRHCFRGLAADLSQHRVLCETYDFLGIPVGIEPLDDLFRYLKAGKNDYDLEYKRVSVIRGDKSRARDTAFKLVYKMLFGTFGNEKTDSAKVYNAVLFVVSHAAIFKYKTRTVVRAAYDERFVSTPKQKAALDKWVKDIARASQEDDDTTEEEDYDIYLSDDSW